ncbi:MAG: tetratricopeptide repeat protein [Myxococcales bacterium]|nr:tetratricopeptide repeat protein [Myxococcales bacterium]
MFWMVAGALGIAPPAHAEDVDLSSALEQPKKASWDPKRKTMDAYGRGNTQRRKGNNDDALPLLVQALEKQPGCGKCLNGLALALIDSERFDQAIEVGNLIDVLYPDRKEGKRHVGTAQRKAERWGDAAETYAAAVEQDPKSSTMWWRRVDSLRRDGQSETATELLEDAKDTELEKGAIACLEIQLAASAGDAVGARALWETCDESKNLDLKRYSEGWLAMAEGDAELAAKRLVVSGADENLARIALAFHRLDEGKSEGALNLLDRMANEGGDPRWDGALARARALYGLQRYDEAVEALASGPRAEGWQDAVSEPPRDAVNLVARGPDWPKQVMQQAAELHIRLLAAKGEAEAAQALHDEVVQVMGEDERFTEALTPPSDDAPE